LTTPLAPWTTASFELLVHAEGHLQAGDDFDRRIALISYDNAIEAVIATYLTLKPIQRGGRTYQNAHVEVWLENYHTKLDFLEAELKTRAATWDVERATIVWVHDQRNTQYHGGDKGTPEKLVLQLVRKTALWVFSFLFEVKDVEARLAGAIVALKPQIPTKDEASDNLIDSEHGTVEVCGDPYPTSEAVYGMDPNWYRELAEEIKTKRKTGASP
jgi:hypothetical protein